MGGHALEGVELALGSDIFVFQKQPDLFDAFFESMAVVIMFGLGFATILTLIVVPVLYTLAYGIKPGREEHV